MKRLSHSASQCLPLCTTICPLSCVCRMRVLLPRISCASGAAVCRQKSCQKTAPCSAYGPLEKRKRGSCTTTLSASSSKISSNAENMSANALNMNRESEMRRATLFTRVFLLVILTSRLNSPKDRVVAPRRSSIPLSRQLGSSPAGNQISTGSVLPARRSAWRATQKGVLYLPLPPTITTPAPRPTTAALLADGPASVPSAAGPAPKASRMPAVKEAMRRFTFRTRSGAMRASISTKSSLIVRAPGTLAPSFASPRARMNALQANA